MMLENVFMQILDMTKTASIVIAVVLVARLLLKKAPKWISYTLWAVVLLRLLCPFSIEAPVSAVPRMETLSVEMVDSTLPRFEFETPADRQINQHVLETTPPGEPYALVTRSFEPSQWLSFIWMAGIAVMLIYSVVSYIRLRRRLVGAVPLRDNIYLADRITSPFVMGIILPKIYLPSALSEREQEYIILHEQRHIRRLDHVMKVLAFAALCLHWFNPLVWLAFILAGKDMEMSCDESVIKTLGSEIRADYSASLLSLATGRRLIAGTPLAFGEGDTRGRIKNLAKWKKPVIWIVIIALLLCAVLAVCLLTDPVDKGDILRSVEREHDIVRPGLEAAYEMELGEEVKSGTVVAEIWTNGECRQSIPVNFTDADTELSISMHLRKEGEKYSGVEIEVNPSPSAGSLITYFPIPEYYEYLGWSTTAYEEKDEVKVKPGEAEIIAAMAFDVGNGVRSMDCQSLTEEPWRLKEYDCIIIILAGFSADEVPTQQVTLAEPEPPVEVLQLHHVIKLAEKGYELGWADFEDFYFIETRQGLYVREYEIDETFTLSIEGKSPDGGTEPIHIYLCANGLDERIDIRDGGVEEFIERARAEKETLQGEMDENATFYRLANITADDIERISGDFGRGIDPFAMAEALNGAPANRVARTEDIMAHWNIDVYTTDGDECVAAYAGAEENVVKLYHHTSKQKYTEWYFEDKMLYDTVKMGFLPLERVQPSELAKYENIIDARAKARIEENSQLEHSSGFTGYEITEFYEYDRFENGDEQFVVYKWDVAFTVADPDEVEWAGGMWLDGMLRVRAYESCTYFVVRTVGGETVDHKFMFYDVYNGAGTDEERSRAHNEITAAWRRDALPEEGTVEREMYDVIQVFFKEVYDIDEDCDIAKLFLDENDPYIDYCREKNKLFFGIGKIYDDPLIFVATEVEAERMEINEAGNGNYTVDTSFVLYVTNESSPDVVGSAVFPATFVFADTSDGCKIVSVNTDDDMDRVLAHSSADEQLQVLREEYEGRDIEKKMQEIQNFVNTLPNNGFIAINFYENVWEADLYQIIYQCTDDSVSYEEVAAAYKAEIGEVYTDISYISGKNLDKLLKKLTGYGLDDKSWNFGNTKYLESIDVYCVMHGDTNYAPVACTGINAEGDIITAYFRKQQYDHGYIKVVLRSLDGGEYQFISCKQY